MYAPLTNFVYRNFTFNFYDGDTPKNIFIDNGNRSYWKGLSIRLTHYDCPELRYLRHRKAGFFASMAAIAFCTGHKDSLQIVSNSKFGANGRLLGDIYAYDKEVDYMNGYHLSTYLFSCNFAKRMVGKKMDTRPEWLDFELLEVEKSFKSKKIEYSKIFGEEKYKEILEIAERMNLKEIENYIASHHFAGGIYNEV